MWMRSIAKIFPDSLQRNAVFFVPLAVMRTCMQTNETIGHSQRRVRHTPKCKLVVMDLTAPHSNQLLQDCGGLLRCRGSDSLTLRHLFQSQGNPLARRVTCPTTFQHLHGLKGCRLCSRPKLTLPMPHMLGTSFYSFCFLHSNGIPWSIENPTNSWKSD